MFTQCTTLLLNANSLLPVFDTEPPLWALQRFQRSRLLSENYSDALQILVRSWRGKTSPAGHLTGSWNKEAHKPLRQHPSDHDKYAICKTRTAEVYTLRVWAGRVKHICVSASGDLSSHAARWLVLVLSWFVYPGQLKQIITHLGARNWLVHISWSGWVWSPHISTKLNETSSWMLSGTLSKLFSSKHLNNVSVANSQISMTVMGFVIINDKSVFSKSFTNIRRLQNTEKTVHILHVCMPPWHFYRMCESCQASDHWSRLHEHL